MSNSERLHGQLPIPTFFNPDKVGHIYQVNYRMLEVEGEKWAKEHNISPARLDEIKVGLLIIDDLNCFAIKECDLGYGEKFTGELFVGGRSGMGAVKNNITLNRFIYRDMRYITKMFLSTEAHHGMQLFFTYFLVNSKGEHPVANQTIITPEDIIQGKWFINRAVVYSVMGEHSDEQFVLLQQHLLRYVQKLARNRNKNRRFPLTIWEYHGMQGSIGNALVSAIDEATFFHEIVRQINRTIWAKADNPFSEAYSILRPEVNVDPKGRIIKADNKELEALMTMDILLVAGQASSHCVPWTMDDLIAQAKKIDRSFVKKIYYLTDCMSPVVIPGIVDYTEHAEREAKRFEKEGVRLITTETPLADLIAERKKAA